MSQHFLCRADDVPEGDARGFEVEGHALVAVRRDGVLRVYLNWCPHLGIELNFMPDQFLDGDGQFLMCANHGALFEIETGDCLSGPCSGDRLRPVPHEEREGEIWLTSLPEASEA